MKPIDLRCEYKTNPLGIDVVKPRLYWSIEAESRCKRQLAYQIVVRTGEEIIWDSGRVESDETAHIVYEGKPLSSHQKCAWKVRVWDQDNGVFESSFGKKLTEEK